ncbi:MAG: LmbE family protein, partial [Mucilaginibacter sp.]
GIAIIRKSFDADNPEQSVPALVKLLAKVEKVADVYWRTQKTKELDNLVAACAGLWFESYAAEPSYGLHDSILIRSQVLDRYNNKVKLNTISINQTEKSYNSQVIPANQLQTFDSKASADKITQPFWLETLHSVGAYNIPGQLYVGNPENPDLPTVNFEFIIEGMPIRFERRLYYKYVSPVNGEIYQPIEIAPQVTANVASQDYIFSSSNPQSIQIKLKSYAKSSGYISIKPMPGWKVSPDKYDFADKIKGDEWTVAFTVTPTDGQSKNVMLEVLVNGSPAMGVQHIKYDHIPNITLFPPAQTRLINIDLKIAGKKIGYIEGAGDLVPEALRQVGYDVHELTEKDIMNGDLSGYDAIITGVRAYNVNPRLAVEQPKLLEYVKNGGNLVVQYNNNNGLVTKQIGPYPFKPVNQRVTDENAKITILDKQNPILNYPNKVTDEDFNGWTQERGLYFVGDIDPQYKSVMEMNDPGEAPNKGAVITGNYGEGRFVYTSLAFFRQLPAGVPGAYKLFINLLSKPKNTVIP